MKIDVYWFKKKKKLDYWYIFINLEIKIIMRKLNCLKSNYIVIYFIVYIYL